MRRKRPAEMPFGRWTDPACRSSPPGRYGIESVPFSIADYIVTTVPGTMLVVPTGQLENPTRGMTSQTSDLYDRNIGLPGMCWASGPPIPVSTLSDVDLLSIEWSRVRQKPNLGNCVDLGQRNACSDF